MEIFSMNFGGCEALAFAAVDPPAGWLLVVDRLKVLQLVAPKAIVATNNTFFTM